MVVGQQNSDFDVLYFNQLNLRSFFLLFQDFNLNSACQPTIRT